MIGSISENQYDQLIEAGWASIVCDNNFLPSYDREHDSRAKAPYCDSAEDRWIKCLGHKLTRGLPLMLYPYFDPQRTDDTIVFPHVPGSAPQQGKVIYKCWGEINGLTRAKLTDESDCKVWLTTPPVIGIRELNQRPVFLKIGKDFKPEQIDQKISDYQTALGKQLFALTVRVFNGQLPANLMQGLI